MRKNLVKLSVMFTFLFITGLAFMFGNNQNYDVQCFDNFEYEKDNKEQLNFIRNQEIKKGKNGCENVESKWHLKVYFDGNGNWVKFENYNHKNQLLRTFHNTLSIKNNTLANQ